MAWLEPGEERDRLHRALTAYRVDITWKKQPADYVLEELDSTRFTSRIVLEMAAAQVGDTRRRVYTNVDKEKDMEKDWGHLEPRWYAVELECDELVFFKMKFLKDSGTRLKIVSAHPQEEPWNQPKQTPTARQSAPSAAPGK